MNEFNENGEQGVITGMLHNFPGTMPGSDTDFSLKEDPEEQSTGSIPVECDSTAELKTCRPAVEGDVIELGGEFDYEGYQVVRREFFAHIKVPTKSLAASYRKRFCTFRLAPDKSGKGKPS